VPGKVGRPACAAIEQRSSVGASSRACRGTSISAHRHENARAPRLGTAARRSAAAGKALRLAPGGTSLHVHDHPVPNRQHLKALVPAAVGAKPLRRTDDLVPDLREVGLDVEPPLASPLNLERQDRTGLVWAVSDRRPLPPQTATRHAPPLCRGCDQRRERLRITPIERLRSQAKPVDHAASMPGPDSPRLRGEATQPRRSAASSGWPPNSAHPAGVLSWSASRTPGSAPSASSVSTASRLPACAARCSAVTPSP